MNAHRIVGAVAMAVSLTFASAFAAPPAPSAEAKAQLVSGGKVRVALINVANFVAQPASKPPAGMGVDIGKMIAERAGAAFEPIVYDSVAALLADARSGKYDVALLGSDPAREKDFEFTKPFAFVQNSYMVPAGSALMTIPDVDGKGVKVAVGENSVQHNVLKAKLKQAEVLGFKGLPEVGVKEVADGKANAFAANRGTLEEIAAKMPGYRIIPGSFSDITYNVGVPKGRTAAAAYLDEVVRDMVASGAIADSIGRAKLKGVVSAK